MIPWGWAVVMFVFGAWFGLLVVGLLKAVDLPQRREGTE